MRSRVSAWGSWMRRALVARSSEARGAVARAAASASPVGVVLQSLETRVMRSPFGPDMVFYAGPVGDEWADYLVGYGVKSLVWSAMSDYSGPDGGAEASGSVSDVHLGGYAEASGTNFDSSAVWYGETPVETFGADAGTAPDADVAAVGTSDVSVDADEGASGDIVGAGDAYADGKGASADYGFDDEARDDAIVSFGGTANSQGLYGQGHIHTEFEYDASGEITVSGLASAVEGGGFNGSSDVYAEGPSDMPGARISVDGSVPAAGGSASYTASALATGGNVPSLHAEMNVAAPDTGGGGGGEHVGASAETYLEAGNGNGITGSVGSNFTNTTARANPYASATGATDSTHDADGSDSVTTTFSGSLADWDSGHVWGGGDNAVYPEMAAASPRPARLSGDLSLGVNGSDVAHDSLQQAASGRFGGLSVGSGLDSTHYTGSVHSESGGRGTASGSGATEVPAGAGWVDTSGWVSAGTTPQANTTADASLEVLGNGGGGLLFSDNHIAAGLGLADGQTQGEGSGALNLHDGGGSRQDTTASMSSNIALATGSVGSAEVSNTIRTAQTPGTISSESVLTGSDGLNGWANGAAQSQSGVGVTSGVSGQSPAVEGTGSGVDTDAWVTTTSSGGMQGEATVHSLGEVGQSTVTHGNGSGANVYTSFSVDANGHVIVPVGGMTLGVSATGVDSDSADAEVTITAYLDHDGDGRGDEEIASAMAELSFSDPAVGLSLSLTGWTAVDWSVSGSSAHLTAASLATSVAPSGGDQLVIQMSFRADATGSSNEAWAQADVTV